MVGVGAMAACGDSRAGAVEMAGGGRGRDALMESFLPPPPVPPTPDGSGSESLPPAGNWMQRLRDSRRDHQRQNAEADIEMVRLGHVRYREFLESDEPDGSGNWNPVHRRKVLRYLAERDFYRCGLCGGPTKLSGSQVEHIVPKKFVWFGLENGKVDRTRGEWLSKSHGLDNLQIAHTYCNEEKGNTPLVAGWRHFSMPSLVVAAKVTGEELMLPASREDGVDESWFATANRRSAPVGNGGAIPGYHFCTEEAGRRRVR